MAVRQSDARGDDRRRAGRLLALPLLVAWAVPASSAEPPGGEPLRSPLRVSTQFRYLGTGSCGSTPCHNGRVAKPAIEGSEHVIWSTRDRHSTAYTVLLGERSRRIERNYRRVATARPEADALCLNCHAHMKYEPARHSREYDLADGVGCESCHGAAEAWIVPHVSAGWKSWSPDQKAAYGFFPTDDTLANARMCAECHVGSTRTTTAGELVEVNHDLIAAGHPRLAFEYAAYLGIEPKHWVMAKERARQPDREARNWAVGQVASLQASLDLLAARAARAERQSPGAKGRAPWPELAEYGCWSCHHDLTDPSRTQERGYAGREPGSLPWNTWYTPTLEALVQKVGPAGVPTFDAQIDELRSLMATPYPDPAEVGGLARQSADGLESWLATLRATPVPSRSQRDLLGALAALDRGAPLDWDASTQAYLGLAALHQALGENAPGLRDPRMRDSLAAIARRLAYPPRTDSPSPSALGNPIARELDKVRVYLNR